MNQNFRFRDSVPNMSMSTEQHLSHTENSDCVPSWIGLKGSKLDGTVVNFCSSVDSCWNLHPPFWSFHTLQLMSRDQDPLCSTRSTRSPSCSKSSTPSMYSLTKWFGDTADLGIHMSPNLGMLSCLSAKSGATLRKVGSEKEALLEFWDPNPAPCSIGRSQPDPCTSVKSDVRYFYRNVPSASLVRVYASKTNKTET
jgi:hypothetical protein